MPADDGAASGSVQSSDDWAGDVTSRIEQGVSLIRDRTVVPVVKIARLSILALLGMAIGTFAAVAFTIGIIRILDSDAFKHHVWASYFVVGGIFTAGGLLLMRIARRQ